MRRRGGPASTGRDPRRRGTSRGRSHRARRRGRPGRASPRPTRRRRRGRRRAAPGRARRARCPSTGRRSGRPPSRPRAAPRGGRSRRASGPTMPAFDRYASSTRSRPRRVRARRRRGRRAGTSPPPPTRQRVVRGGREADVGLQPADEGPRHRGRDPRASGRRSSRRRGRAPRAPGSPRGEALERRPPATGRGRRDHDRDDAGATSAGSRRGGGLRAIRFGRIGVRAPLLVVLGGRGEEIGAGSRIGRLHGPGEDTCPTLCATDHECLQQLALRAIVASTRRPAQSCRPPGPPFRRSTLGLRSPEGATAWMSARASTTPATSPSASA